MGTHHRRSAPRPKLEAFVKEALGEGSEPLDLSVRISSAIRMSSRLNPQRYMSLQFPTAISRCILLAVEVVDHA